MGPKRKEEKETVVYPASKRKAAPFRPPRPSKAPRTDSNDSASVPRTSSKTVVDIEDDDDSDDTLNPHNKVTHDAADDALEAFFDTDDDDELPEPTIQPKPKPKPATKAKATSSKPPPARKKSSRAPSPSPSDSDSEDLTTGLTNPQNDSAPPVPSQSDSIPSIPQALLVRLLHEHFTDKTTRIDTHAIQVLQKYMEVFVRESIERARMAKREAVANGEARVEDRGFLEVEDLEKVAPSIMLDF